MERITVEVQVRKEIGKSAARKVRFGGDVPAIVYGHGANIPVKLSPASIKPLKAVNFSETVIIDMAIDTDKNSETMPVMIKDIQFHPLSEQINHIDFYKVSLTEKVRVHVPLLVKGQPKGIKEGAVLEQILREIEVEGLALDIPQKLEVDVSGLEVGHSIHVSDVAIPDNTKIITALDETAVALVAKEEEAPEPEAEASESAAAAEPEVIKEKKEEAQGSSGK